MSRPVIDKALKLEVHRAVVAARRYPGGACRWVWTCDGKATSSVKVELETVDGEPARLRLSFVAAGEAIEQSIALESEPCRFGGVRWFARCPARHRRAAKLYSFGGGFYSRHAFGPHTYLSNNDAPGMARVIRKRNRHLFGKLKTYDAENPRRPRGMWQRTHERLLARHLELEEQADCALAGIFARAGDGLSRLERTD